MNGSENILSDGLVGIPFAPVKNQYQEGDGMANVGRLAGDFIRLFHSSMGKDSDLYNIVGQLIYETDTLSILCSRSEHPLQHLDWGFKRFYFNGSARSMDSFEKLVYDTLTNLSKTYKGNS